MSQPRADRHVSGQQATDAAAAIWAVVNHPNYRPVRLPSEAWGPEDPRISAAEDARDFPTVAP